MRRPAAATLPLIAAQAAVPAAAAGRQPCGIDPDHPTCPAGGGVRRERECCVSTPPAPASEHLDNCGGSRPVGLPFAGRSPVYAHRGMAATSQALASEAAVDILRRGGSAADAAIAANAVQGVVEPMSNGIGGDLFAIVWDPRDGALAGYNGAGRAAEGLPLARLRELIDRDFATAPFIPSRGPLTATVPGAVQGWCDLHARYGRLPLRDVLEPAVRAADEGFPVTPVIAEQWRAGLSCGAEQTSGGRFPRACDGFLAAFSLRGAAPRVGETVTNHALAETLSRVAEGGCGEFYNGSVAAAIEAFAAEAGTHLTRRDMAAHHGEWVAPVGTTYRGRYELFELPPNPQGIAAQQQLNILEHYNLTALGHNSADYLHLHVEAKKLAYADRARWYGDPDFAEVPVAGLLSKEYAAQRLALIDEARAAERVDAGTPARQHDAVPHSSTVYIAAADDSGMMVSLIQSVYSGFGSGLAVPGTGFVLQNRGAGFATRPGPGGEGQNNIYAPGRRPFHTIIPAFVFRDGAPWLAYGVMGGNVQAQGHAQVLCNLVDFGMNLQEAGDAARYYHRGSGQPSGEAMEDGGYVEVEAGVCAAARAELARRGHHLVAAPNGGGYQAVAVEDGGWRPCPARRRHRRGACCAAGELCPDSGEACGDCGAASCSCAPRRVYIGASELRKDGQAVGY